MKNFDNSYSKFVIGLDQINEAAVKYPEEFILNMENKYKKEISCAVDSILSMQPVCKIIMLAGPSGSGKTTTSHMIIDELKMRGKQAVIISLDDFYKGNGNAPLTNDGQLDYEAVEALNIDQIKECINGLMNDGCCDVPQFDFKQKAPGKEKRHIELLKDGIAIVEGIHGLNPMFTTDLSSDGILKIYISVKQGLNDYNGEIFSRKDIRLVRRLVRDFNHRESDAEVTFSMWDNVCRGEFLYIHPFKRTSDITINSIHTYEPCVLTHTGISLLNSIQEESPYFYFAKKVLSGLERFYPIDSKFVPKTSLIREFIGGGIYE